MAATTLDADQQAIAAAFGKASADDLSKVVMNEDTKTSTETFILKCPAYYNLQNYIFTALKLDSTDATFKAHYEYDTLKNLRDLEDGIYEKVMRTSVDLFNNCHTFDGASMQKFTQVGASVVNYCNDFARYVGGKGLLMDLIKTLTDESASLSSVKTAQKQAAAVANILVTRAHDRAAECSALQGEIKAFKDLTMRDKIRVDYLVNQFLRNGPYEPASSDSTNFNYKLDGNGHPCPRTASDGSVMKTYYTTLNKQLNDLLAAAKADADAARDDYAEWKEDTIIAATAVTYIWCYPIGTIAGAVTMGIYAKRAVDALASYNAETTKSDQETKEATALKACMDIVSQLDCVFDNLETVITKAIEALGKMEAQFLTQKAGFDALKDTIASVDTSNRDNDVAVRSLASIQLDDALQSWLKIKTLANDFIASATVNYTYV